MNPPVLAVWLLESALPDADGEAISGDLHEEFRAHILPTRGARSARWWFRWQVVRSLAPLFFRSWQRASVTRASLALVLAALVSSAPAALLLTLRAFILQQVPLKTTAVFSTTFAIALALVVACATATAFAVATRLLFPDRARPFR
jgi:hypothetical protein